MQRKGLQRIGAEPFGQLANVLPAGVVEVLTSGKDLYRLGPRAPGNFQQPGMEPLIEEQVGRKHALHGQGNVPCYGPESLG